MPRRQLTAGQVVGKDGNRARKDALVRHVDDGLSGRGQAAGRFRIKDIPDETVETGHVGTRRLVPLE